MTLVPGSVIRNRLFAGERMLTDGAMGTELIRLGVRPKDTLRANRHMAHQVTGIHESYLDAGAKALVSNTFGMYEGDDWQSNLKFGVELAVNAAQKSVSPVAVMVSLSSSLILSDGAILPFLRESVPYWPRFVLIETCTSLSEAIRATQSVRRCTDDLLAVTCHFLGSGDMPDGSAPHSVAQALVESGADIVGANCGETPEAFVPVAVRMRSATDAPLLFAPSAGLPAQTASAEWSYPITPEEFADTAEKLMAAGVNLIGGCCGTSPAYISAVRHKLF